MLRRIAPSVWLAALLSLLMVPALAYAETVPTATLSISPPVLELSANPGETLNHEIRVDNVSSKAREVTTQVRNVTALGEEGQANLTEEETAYTLGGWISVNPAKSRIASNASQVYKFRIEVPADASPGGHFGSVVFKTNVLPGEDGANLAVNQEVGALIFLRVAGEAKESLSIKEFAVSNNIWKNRPIKFNVRVANQGNTHLRSSGTITITDLFGRKVATVPLDGKLTLPESVRRLDTSWQPTKNLFGRYTATASLVYGTNQQKTVTASTGFYILPVSSLIILTVILIAVVGAIMARRRIKRAVKVLLGKE